MDVIVLHINFRMEVHIDSVTKIEYISNSSVMLFHGVRGTMLKGKFFSIICNDIFNI